MNRLRSHVLALLALLAAICLVFPQDASAQSQTDRVEANKDAVVIGLTLQDVVSLVGQPDYHMNREVNGHRTLLLQYRLENSYWLTIAFLDDIVVVVDDEESGRVVTAPRPAEANLQAASRMTTTAVPGHLVDKEAVLYVVQGFSQSTISSLQPPEAAAASPEIQQLLRTIFLQTMKSNGFKAISYEDMASGKDPGVQFSKIIFVRTSAFLLNGLIQLPIAMDEFQPKTKSAVKVWSAAITNVPADFFIQNPAYLIERALALYGDPSTSVEIRW